MRSLLPLSLLTLLVACSSMEPNYRVRTDGTPESRAAAERSHAELMAKLPNVAELDAPLKTLSSPFPDYPQQVRDAQISGLVRVVFSVGEDGRVSNPTVLGSPPSVLAALSLEAIMRWRFEVPRKDGRPTQVRAMQEFTFRVS
ncbi:energy transducer TonB [Paucibacter sp. AS339]|uniref:energy transducer TonB n=1 Tax=Paucibacter hankyongi TaxID=3133434 RepID=UPI0030A55E98